jgi:hypothetical protein
MFKELWKTVDGLFDAVDHLFTDDDRTFTTEDAEKLKATRRHRITSDFGHIRITGEFKSLTINGRKIRLPEEKKK